MNIIITYNRNLKPFAKELRTNMTYAEEVLWSRIRRKQILNTQFFRQKPIKNFILDFYAKKLKLAIELDGSQHFTKAHKSKDETRDQYLASLGIHTLRFTNTEVIRSLPQVILAIETAIKELQ